MHSSAPAAHDLYAHSIFTPAARDLCWCLDVAVALHGHLRCKIYLQHLLSLLLVLLLVLMPRRCGHTLLFAALLFSALL
jgi:ABC-type molybdate transport system permease subunit